MTTQGELSNIIDSAIETNKKAYSYLYDGYKTTVACKTTDAQTQEYVRGSSNARYIMESADEVEYEKMNKYLSNLFDNLITRIKSEKIVGNKKLNSYQLGFLDQVVSNATAYAFNQHNEDKHFSQRKELEGNFLGYFNHLKKQKGEKYSDEFLELFAISCALSGKIKIWQGFVENYANSTYPPSANLRIEDALNERGNVLERMQSVNNDDLIKRADILKESQHSNFLKEKDAHKLFLDYKAILDQ